MGLRLHFAGAMVAVTRRRSASVIIRQLSVFFVKMLFKERVVIGAFICFFTYRTFVASGFQSLIVPMVLSNVNRRRRHRRFENKRRSIENRSHSKKKNVTFQKPQLERKPVESISDSRKMPESPVRNKTPAFVDSMMKGAFQPPVPDNEKAARQQAKEYRSSKAAEPLPTHQHMLAATLGLPRIDSFPENMRLIGGAAGWKKWGPYLSDRQWSTVREDLSPDGSSWEYFPHDDARARAYRWGEDGLLGLSDERCQICFSLSFWNGKDPIIKERLFGVTGLEGNHGEDCKECVYYLDSTPSHSYMKALYKYPQAEYPYGKLVEKRSVLQPELELQDTGIFDDNRYWDIFAEYAKESPDEVLMRITIRNRAPEASTLQFIPQLWYRNTWRWSSKENNIPPKPLIQQVKANQVCGNHDSEIDSCNFFLGPSPDGSLPVFLFTENETNTEKINDGLSPESKYVKDAFHKYVVNGDVAAVNPANIGTKFGAQYMLDVPAYGEVVIKFKLAGTQNLASTTKEFGSTFDQVFADRIDEANGFYQSVIPANLNKEEKAVARQAYAGLLWNKQFYEFDVEEWVKAVPAFFAGSRREHFRENWSFLHYSGIFSVTDKWEYPWLSNWDLAFSVVPLAKVDHRLALKQLQAVMQRENIGLEGELPGCEFNFSDVYPPVGAWAVWKVYNSALSKGERDTDALKFFLMALTYQFNRWLTKTNSEGKKIANGGYIQMNNIGFIDCSKDIEGFYPELSDNLPWTMFYCRHLIKLAMELVQDNCIYEEVIIRLSQFYMELLSVLNKQKLYYEKDSFYYTIMRYNKQSYRVKVKSISGFLPLLGCIVLDNRQLKCLSQFQKMIKTESIKHPKLFNHISFLDESNDKFEKLLMSVPTAEQLKAVLKCMLDEDHFLSPYGIRSLSKLHKEDPFTITVMIKGHVNIVQYVAGESNDYLFGGNNNWRGPIWINMNYLIIEALEEYYSYYEDNLKVECPTGSGNLMNLMEVSKELSSRIAKLLLPNENGRRPCHGDDPLYQSDANWKDLCLFHECFNGDNGKGCGASHATGWTALIIDLLGRHPTK